MKGAEWRKYTAALGLAYACTSGNAVLRLLRRHPLESVWHAGQKELENLGMQPIPARKFLQAKRTQAALPMIEEAWLRLEGAGLRFVPCGTPGYPPQLLELSHPPAGLFLKGDAARLDDLGRSARITIVGTRRATAYGTRAARELASALRCAGNSRRERDGPRYRWAES
jgi:predicted Rossmann fold nucleotide-binding protein DprA/Smf involved in DNA uptake